MSLAKKEKFDVVIVGAGAAGVGMGSLLRLLGVKKFILLERQEVGASFGKWPREMNFITPSFPGHGFGMLDLNAVVPNTSPGHIFKSEHPDGQSYRIYLKSVAAHFELPVRTGVDVTGIVPLPAGGLDIETDNGTIRSRFVIWAAGEYQYPSLDAFPGSEHCIHNSAVASWRDIKGEDVVVIGGFESGIDAAVNLAALGKKVSVYDREEAWKGESSDPSCSLSPYTSRRLISAVDTGLLTLNGNSDIKGVKKTDGGYVVSNGRKRLFTSSPPILATGFKSSLVLARNLFEWEEKENYPLLTEKDESTITPGLFLTGPNVRHGELIFCFIYKFRQRFAVIASELAGRLGRRKLDESVLDFYREKGMFLDDLSCCGDECQC